MPLLDARQGARLFLFRENKLDRSFSSVDLLTVIAPKVSAREDGWLIGQDEVLFQEDCIFGSTRLAVESATPEGRACAGSKTPGLHLFTCWHESEIATMNLVSYHE